MGNYATRCGRSCQDTWALPSSLIFVSLADAGKSVTLRNRQLLISNLQTMTFLLMRSMGDKRDLGNSLSGYGAAGPASWGNLSQSWGARDARAPVRSL